MFHNLNIPDNCQILWKTCQSLVPELLTGCPVKSAGLKIIKSKPIEPKSKSLYHIKSGIINETYEGQVVVIYEEGDLIGADGLLQEKATAFENDFAVIVDEYDGQQFLESILKDNTKFTLWNQYLSCLSQSYQLLMNHFSKQEAEFSPEFRHYKKGDVIIEENTQGDEVYTLLSGSTRVVSNNIEVGEVNKDEIFGAIAALTNTNRSASIIATTDCETLVVKSDSFRSLLAARPDTVQKLINDMARTIVSCNERITELSKKEN